MINHVTKNEADGAAIGARLRRLSERIDREATAIYADLDIAFEQRWYGPLNLIAERGTASVTDIARLLGISHSAVSQARRSLVLAGFVEERADPSDKRSRLLSLSGKGAALIGSLAPVWASLNRAAKKLNDEAGDVAATLDRLEARLDQLSLADRYAAEASVKFTGDVE